MQLTKKEFEKIVYQKFNKLPKQILKNIENLEIFVEEYPPTTNILGLYHGVPFPYRKSATYSLMMPDKIVLFKTTIEKRCSTKKEIEDKIEKVLFHEIAHYLGLDEKGVSKLKL